MLSLKPKDGSVISVPKRARYIDGVAAKDVKMSSVKKAFMIGLIPGVEENYTNIKTLLTSVDLSGLPVTFSCDLKLCLFLVGKMNGACKCPCPFCAGSDPWDGNLSLLTIGDLKEWYRRYHAALAKDDSTKALNFNNCIDDNLLQLLYPDDRLVLDCINVMELHIMMGVIVRLLQYVQSCFGNLPEEKQRGEVFVKDFLTSLNITMVLKGRLEGNQCNKIAENSAQLLYLASQIPEEDISDNIQGVACVLEAFNAVKHSCFGMEIRGDYREEIARFSTLYRRLPGITVPPKIHILESHIVGFLERKKAEGFPEHLGLAYWGEQVFEQMHHDYKVQYQRWAVGEDHEDYATAMFNAFLDYNSSHI